jgi:hypothetical protein
MGMGSVWEGFVRWARREEEADPQWSVTGKQRRQRVLASITVLGRASGGPIVHDGRHSGGRASGVWSIERSYPT